MIFSKVLHLAEGKVYLEKIWNILLFKRRTFSPSEVISIPVDKVLQMHSPSIDCEVEISGELYIL